MISFASESLLGVGILLAWIGWGALVNRYLVGERELDWGQQGVFGVSLLVVVGGVFEMLSIISPPLVLTLIGIGLCLWALDMVRRGRPQRFDPKRAWAALRAHPLASAGVALAVLLLTARYLAAVHTVLINPHDDAHAYLVFPVKMLQTGSIGEEPFNHRRLVTALGGKYFLDTFTLSIGSVLNLHLVDSGLGLVLASGVMVGALRHRRATAGATAGLLLLLALLPAPRTNMSALFLGVALLIGFYRTLDGSWLRARPVSRTVAASLVAAAIVTLKYTFIPVVVLTLAVTWLLALRTEPWRRVARDAQLGILLLVVFVLPWMLSQYRSSETLLYPFLGRGVDASQFGLPTGSEEFRTAANTMRLLGVCITQRLFLAVVATTALMLIGRPRPRERSDGSSIAIALAAGLAAIVVVIATTANGTTLRVGAERFCFPFLLAAYVSLLIAATKRAGVNGQASGTPWRRAGLVAVAILLCVAYLPELRDERTEVRDGIRSGMLQPQPLPWGAYGPAQSAVPEGARILARLDYPFLLDFKRNPVFVVDHPAMVSRPPGMPAFRGPEALAAYLQGQGIRWVMFSYRNEANYSAQLFGDRLSAVTHPVWRTFAQRTFDFNGSLQQLGHTRRRVWDNGWIFVLDLSAPSGS